MRKYLDTHMNLRPKPDLPVPWEELAGGSIRHKQWSPRNRGKGEEPCWRRMDVMFRWARRWTPELQTHQPKGQGQQLEGATRWWQPPWWGTQWSWETSRYLHALACFTFSATY